MVKHTITTLQQLFLLILLGIIKMKKLVKILSVTMPTMTCFAIGNNTIIPSILQPSKKQNITKADLNDLYGANVNIGSFDQKPNGETVLSSVKIVESGFHNESPV
jgi:hypothetical protein